MSIRRKAYKFLLIPNLDQKEYFSKCFGSVRFLYNQMLEDRIALYQKYKGDKEALKLNKPKTYSQWKLEYPWLYDVDNQALANAQMQLRTAYTNFFRDPKVGFPKFRSKKSGKNTYTTNNNLTGNIRICDRRIHLPKIGWIKIVQHRIIPDYCKIKAATIELTPSGRYNISILTEYDWDPPTVELSKDLILGLDYSLPHFYIDSQGVAADMPHFYREAEAKLAMEQRKLSRMVRGSSNYRKQQIVVAKHYERVSNCRKDWAHKKSCALANQWDYVVVEDINLRQMAGTRRLGKSVNDCGFGMFRDFLQYKLYDRGKVLIKIDRWFPSSKMCSECGGINDKLTLSTREWTCECGAHHDRDLNAAINIRNVGLAMIG